MKNSLEMIDLICIPCKELHKMNIKRKTIWYGAPSPRIHVNPKTVVSFQQMLKSCFVVRSFIIFFVI